MAPPRYRSGVRTLRRLRPVAARPPVCRLAGRRAPRPPRRRIRGSPTGRLPGGRYRWARHADEWGILVRAQERREPAVHQSGLGGLRRSGPGTVGDQPRGRRPGAPPPADLTLNPKIKLAFASGTDALNRRLIEHLRALNRRLIEHLRALYPEL